MGYREIIPPDLLKKFDELGPRGVQAKLDVGAYGGKKKKYAALYVAQATADHDASLSASREARAEENLSIARSAVRMSKKHLIIAIIAIIVVIAIAILK